MASTLVSETSRLLPAAGTRQPASDPTIRIFWLLMAAHGLLWWAICLVTQPNMPLDMIEMLYWGQQFELGYHKHPPLPAWLTAITFGIGGGHPWLCYALSQATILTTFWAVWQLAREGLRPWPALAAVALLQTCYYCTLTINDINNTIITRPMWALAILFLYRAATREDARASLIYWCLTGVVIGLGMLSKYYMAVLVIVMLVVPIAIPSTRRHLKTSGPWAMVAIAALMFLPHAIWIVDNDFTTIRYVFNRSEDAGAAKSWLSHLTSPVMFVVTQLMAVIPMIIVAWPTLKNSLASDQDQSISERDNHERITLFRRYVIIVACGPILFYMLVGLVTGSSIRSMWGGPLFSYFGLLLMVAGGCQAIDRSLLKRCVIAGAVMMIALTVRNAAGPLVRDNLSRIHFPGAAVAKEVNRRWNAHFDEPLSVLGGEMFVAGSVNANCEHPIDVYAGMIPAENPWTSDAEVNRQGAVLVWKKEDIGLKKVANWKQRFPRAFDVKPLIANSRGHDVVVEMLIVPPANERMADNRDTSAQTIPR